MSLEALDGKIMTDEDRLLEVDDFDGDFDGNDIELLDSTVNGDGANGEDEQGREEVRMRVREMEEEAAKLKQLQNTVDHQMVSGSLSTSLNNSGQAASSSTTAHQHLSQEAKADADNRSVYVGNVDYGSTAEELETHFHGCGSINRVTILCNKSDGHPKGFAYIEFADKGSVQTAMAMDESLFRGRLIKVSPKRTNRPGLSARGVPISRPFRGRGFRGSHRGFRPTRRGRSFRRSHYHPY